MPSALYTTIISDYSDFLKDWYTSIIQETAHRHSPFMDRMTTIHDSISFRGNQLVIPVQFFSLAGAAARGEDQALPTPMPGLYDRAVVTAAYQYVVLRLSGPAMKSSESDAGSFAPLLAREMSVKSLAFLHNQNRQRIGDGTGVLAHVDGNPAAQVITVDNAWGISDATNGDLFMTKNVWLDAYSPAGVKRNDGFYISAQTHGSDPSTSATITVVGTIDEVVNGDYLYYEGAKDQETGGFLLAVDDGTIASSYEGIAISDQEDWVGTIRYGQTPGTNEALTRRRMNRVHNDMVRKNQAQLDYLICGPDTEEAYIQLAEKSGVVTNPVQLDVSHWEGLAFKGKPLIVDIIFPEKQIGFMDRRGFVVYEMGEAEWIPGDIGVLQKIAGYDAWAAEYRHYYRCGSPNRPYLGLLKDISVPTT